MTRSKARDDTEAMMRRVLAEAAAARENTCCPKRTLLTIIEKKRGKYCIIRKKMRIFATLFSPYETVLSLLKVGDHN